MIPDVIQKRSLLGFSLVASSDGILVCVTSYNVIPFIRGPLPMFFLGIILIVSLYLAGIGEKFIYVFMNERRQLIKWN